MTPAPATDERTAIEHACARLVLQLFSGMDDLRYDRVTDAFAPDGVWHRAGKTLRGRAEILAAMNERDPKRFVRHIISNQVVDVTDDDRATGRCYVTAYAGPADDEPRTINAPWLILTFTATFARSGGAWSIAEARIVRDFVFSNQVA